ncbi:NADH dehydrogenase [Geothermobacter ehrlichii]|uniref:NADH dehydrogenase n=1 Tax=Geothermobacter ehrlichii TaxID=213224 RepID=A0A5D3WK36_9BACT|nr:complex I NDUFA9 subunit family protein [Geothermobacter ehrlichii]TYO99335.1 NADH dehydrogenase [Geothermobacter ehrlichii]
MKVFVTGGTGFVGNEIIRQLIDAGHEVTALVRPGSEKKLAVRDGVTFHRGDATLPESLEGALSGCDAVIHLVGIIREFPAKGITFKRLHFEATRNIVKAAEAQEVKRYLQMSANGTRADAVAPYHRTKWQGEETVRNSILDWTIFRPSLIFGARDQFVNMLAAMIRRYPVMPVIGDGRYRMTPVAVEDVAKGFVSALEKKESIGQIYHCGGPESFTYNEILDLVGRALGKNRVGKLHHPVFFMKPVVALLESLPQFPITSSQLTMLLEGNECDPSEWATTFGIEPTPFFEGITRYLPT